MFIPVLKWYKKEKPKPQTSAILQYKIKSLKFGKRKKKKMKTTTATVTA